MVRAKKRAKRGMIVVSWFSKIPSRERTVLPRDITGALNKLKPGSVERGVVRAACIN